MIKLLKFLLYLLVLPVGLFGGLVVFVFLGIAIVVCFPYGIYDRFRWKQRLRQQSRVIREDSIITSAKSGTLIVDRPSCSSGAKFCWWTPDNVIALAPLNLLSDGEFLAYCKAHKAIPDDFFSEWCSQQYLHEQRGRAALVATWRGERVAQRISEQRPDLQIVETCSGLSLAAMLGQLELEQQAANAKQHKLGEAGT